MNIRLAVVSSLAAAFSSCRRQEFLATRRIGQGRKTPAPPIRCSARSGAKSATTTGLKMKLVWCPTSGTPSMAFVLPSVPFISFQSVEIRIFALPDDFAFKCAPNMEQPAKLTGRSETAGRYSGVLPRPLPRPSFRDAARRGPSQWQSGSEREREVPHRPACIHDFQEQRFPRPRTHRGDPFESRRSCWPPISP